MVVREKRVALKPKGIKNVGNTCFFNSSIQCLLSVTPFITYYKEASFDSSMPISLAFQEFIQEYEKCDVLSPIKFLKSIKDKIKLFNGRQQDSHEFVIQFLEQLHDEIPSKYRNINTKEDFVKHTSENIIADLFFSYNKQTVVCSRCGYKSETPVIMSMIPVDIENTTDLSLKRVYEEEEIAGPESWKCDSCGYNKLSKKKLEVIVTPKVLILYLKRFRSYGYKNNRNIKIEDSLKLGSSTFHNVGVVCHSGSLTEGHYYSDGKRLGTWAHFNDSQISSTVGNYDGSNPYLVFYSRTV
ncbi:Ubiquitin carboxyl-terminal hydrolase 21 [Nosema bombycis CQ1]|uniref:ubiquitinyl hydrolase 1 n=1 Tax=Nosema bombycis (strain CQ1 / CVCC 102059) TaxID=578461 RepID=R0KW95_NOSB1|nr:Ubiquitin carboxyl-terminal hydrolase 21 [Nosema bombycis CQ1]|eukprot:EOB14477.1 Ubiquitin carboxyl-terminal hydrolase 21 [Nosema bombycis CQ1]